MLDKLFYILKENNIEIDEDDFYYGAITLLNYVIFTVMIVFFSILFNIEIRVLFFVLPYIYLRQYTGGIHLNNSISCTLMSTLVALGIPLISNKIVISSYTLISFIFLLNFVILVSFKTANHKNKGLTDNEILFYTKKSIKILLVYFIITLILFTIKFNIGVTGFITAASLCSLELTILKAKILFNMLYRFIR